MVFYKKMCLKEGQVWRITFSNIIVVTIVTQGLPSSIPRRLAKYLTFRVDFHSRIIGTE